MTIIVEQVMRSATRLSLSGLHLVMFVVVAAGCAGRSSQNELASTVSTSSAVPGWLSEDQNSVGVIALGPDQFLYQDWFEFDPAFKDHFARGPTYTTVRPKQLKRKRSALDDAFHEAAESYFISLQNSGSAEGAALGFFLAPAFIAAGTLWRATVGQFNWVRPRPVVRPLKSVDGQGASIPTESLSKHSLAVAIGDRVIRNAKNRSDRVFLNIPFEQAGERSPWTEEVDAFLTVRVQSVDLIADDSDDPRVALFIQVWTNFNRSVSRPFEYTSDKVKLSVLTAADARRLREETNRAIETIADQIVENLIPATSNGP